ncbi:hypothetical protein HG537_0A01200 [Torulaspora globosa]|uniref:Dol-P-Glc:Glc(2)Man(9)GlcNAc(2)-PP-Dol alpha-1,2-glucosyltransferase n=1 Tax=Torulaspora globosa TaxID=48254 RepID=A0A7H9HKM8_9SACH|nr:hypothetical protein HG537_0A01200 [Torulaspora sp. CBS 2947]
MMGQEPCEVDQLDESPQLISPGIQRVLQREVVVGFVSNLVIYPVLVIWFVSTFWFVNGKVVPYVFIDEQFHFGQTLRYVLGDWCSWDAKITTPPGLYVLGWLNYKLVSSFSSWTALTAFRLVNLIGGIVVLPLCVLRPLFLFNAIGFWPVALMCFPLLSTYYYLYYTDVWSTIFILQSLSLVLTQPYGPKVSIWLASGCAALSCTFRQTNIVWTVFIMVIAIERRAAIRKQFNTHRFNNYLKLFIHSIDEFQDTVLPFMLNFALFLVYLIWNKSITLGDKSNHSVGLHLVQILYCFAFIAFFSLPLWFSRNFLRLYVIRLQWKPIRTIFELLGIMVVIRYFTVMHPFLLADNRHYTFYLFKRLIGSHRIILKYILMSIVYHFSTFAYLEVLRPSEMKFDPVAPLPIKDPIDLPIQLTHISWTCLIVCTCLTIIPSPLFEPRYYILPFLFWRLFVTCSAEPIFGELIPAKEGETPVTVSSTKRLFFEFLWFMGINMVTLYIFVTRTFTWETEPFLQRIIW